VVVGTESSTLRGVIVGETLDPDRHELDHEVKAATHHGLTLDRDGNEWVAEVILDI
jgi:SHS2 domain-containing protein